MQLENYQTIQSELDEELTINLKKIFLALWSRKFLMAKVFIAVLLFFILMTFVSAKKYTVDADLYINKSNNSNMAEVNPYVISELGTGGGMAAFMNGGGTLANDIEIMKSPLVIDKVIQQNDIRVKKLFGIIKTKKYGQYVKADKFIKKLDIENKKGTNVVSISYKSKNKDLSYGVVDSIIRNYIALHQELNTDKSKSDKKIIESEYNNAKANLDRKMNSIKGLPQSAMAGAGNIAAMSAFSSSAQKAISNLQGQYVASERSKIELTEEAERVSELAKKLQWAKLVDNMSESSNVVVLKEPRKLQDYEQTSPKLFINILLGIVFGILGAIFAVIYKEITDKKLAYTMLDDEIIYDIKKDFIDLKSILLSVKNEKIAFAIFEDLEVSIMKQLQNFNNISFVRADISDEFEREIARADEVIIIGKIKKTDAKLYKRVKQLIKLMNKKVIVEVLV